MNGAWAGRPSGGKDLRTVISLLPTPRATDGTKGGPNQRGSKGDYMLPSAVVHLLPTPSVADGNGGHTSRSGDRKGELLLGGIVRDVALKLLPTPVVTDSFGARNETSGRPEGSKHHSGRTLGDVTYLDAWGQYAEAIQRWEQVVGRPAPEPTEPTGRGGKHRLAPVFVEWMMGLPEGWVTGIENSRAAQLRALGNGVVPQQAAIALTDMLDEFRHQLLDEVAA